MSAIRNPLPDILTPQLSRLRGYKTKDEAAKAEDRRWLLQVIESWVRREIEHRLGRWPRLQARGYSDKIVSKLACRVLFHLEESGFSDRGDLFRYLTSAVLSEVKTAEQEIREWAKRYRSLEGSQNIDPERIDPQDHRNSGDPLIHRELTDRINGLPCRQRMAIQAILDGVPASEVAENLGVGERQACNISTAAQNELKRRYSEMGMEDHELM